MAGAAAPSLEAEPVAARRRDGDWLGCGGRRGEEAEAGGGEAAPGFEAELDAA